ncbi:lipopolysaccharide biosynthesis protein [Agromyces sp. MMS24-JH15]|uniref:lipopolysaccharide biosynthesis protein n=1 Tax=Agromyces sp. MMS24-JH15 TaxID=3243765 RepID=UPI003749A5C5
MTDSQGRGRTSFGGRGRSRAIPAEAGERRKRAGAVGAVASQGMQALASFTIQVLVAQTLGFDGLGAFAILYGTMQIVSAVAGGFVGDAYAVLDRHDRAIRSALEQFAIAIPVLFATAVAVALVASGLVEPAVGIAAFLATSLFAVEELVRRFLMASLRFWRVVVVDAVAFAVAILVLLGSWLIGEPSLFGFVAAVAAGQFVAAIVGIVLLPKGERRVVPFVRGGYREVFRYGSWRAGQQVLRPAMLTAIRAVVTLTASLAAVGMIEAARTFVAPLTLIVSGLGSFLFVHFAHDREASLAGKLRSADRAVVALVGLIVVGGAAMLLVLPWLGPLLFGEPLDVVTVIGWIAFSTSIAAVAPYGSLASVAGRQGWLFGIRAMDTALAVVLATVLLVSGGDPAFVPAVLAIAPILGGIAVRTFLLVPLVRREASQIPAIVES